VTGLTRKKFIKNMMAAGYSRNEAFHEAQKLGSKSYAELWREYLDGEIYSRPPLIRRRLKCSCRRFASALRQFAESVRRASASMNEIAEAFSRIGRNI